MNGPVRVRRGAAELDWQHLEAVAARIGPTTAELGVPLDQIPDDPYSWAWRTWGPWH